MGDDGLSDCNSNKGAVMPYDPLIHPLKQLSPGICIFLAQVEQYPQQGLCGEFIVVHITILYWNCPASVIEEQNC